MKIGDYVVRIKDLQRPSKTEPVGLLIKKRPGNVLENTQFWDILTVNDGIEVYSERYLEVISESR
jgi:hypothetical protein